MTIFQRLPLLSFAQKASGPRGQTHTYPDSSKQLRNPKDGIESQQSHYWTSMERPKTLPDGASYGRIPVAENVDGKYMRFVLSTLLCHFSILLQRRTDPPDSAHTRDRCLLATTERPDVHEVVKSYGRFSPLTMSPRVVTLL